MNQSKPKRRNQNIEIMRIILMMFIVMHHLTINGYGLQPGLVGKSTISISSSYATFLAMLNSIFVIGVNVFFLVSGYFGIRFKLKRLLKVIAEVYFYSIVLNLLAVLFGFSRISLGNIRKIIFPFLDYWFIYAYVLLYVLSPLINVGLERISENTAKSIYLFFLVLFCLIAFVNDGVVALGRGYTFLFSVFSYITGRMMSMYQLFVPKTVKRSIAYWLLGTFLTAIGAISFICFGKGTYAWHMFSYNSPFVFLSSVFFIWAFIKMPQNDGRFDITKISKHVLAVYLIHSSNDFVAAFRNIPMQWIATHHINYALQLIFLLIYASVIFVACIWFDILRCKLFSKSEEKLINWEIDKISKISLTK